MLMIPSSNLENNSEKAKKKAATLFFYQMSAMKINYDKSGPISIGLDEYRFNEFVKLFCLQKR